jgi:hypothetical protein
LGLSALLLGACGGGGLTVGNGLAGAWSLDGDGKDHSGNKLDLETTGLGFAAGKFGKGLQLSGDGTPIAQRPVNDRSLDLANGDFTVSFWIDFAATASPQFVAVKGFGSDGWFVGWAQTQWAWGLPKGTSFVPPGGSPSTGTFHHVVFQRSGDIVDIRVDESSVGTAMVTATSSSATDPFQVGGFAPGGVSVATAQNVVNGVVDDLAIWHRALSAAELDFLASHAVP